MSAQRAAGYSGGMLPLEAKVAGKAAPVTRQDVILKAQAGHITWTQAAYVLGVTPRHMLRLRERYALHGLEGVRDHRAGRALPPKVTRETLEEVLRLRREIYEDFSVLHFHQRLTERHGLKVSYTWTKDLLQAHGLAERASGRGKYRRKRERRPLRGMLLHNDGSTHVWIQGLPEHDLVIMLDDADGRLLFARFFEEEGTLSTLMSLEHVLRRYGRFCEFYTDRGSHFCRTGDAERGPDEVQNGQVPRVLKALGIRQILAWSPEARGRCERAFRTIQGRLPQELRVAGITTYTEANLYLEQVFIPDFNSRFTVTPAQPESAFTPLAGIDLELLLSIQHERLVRPDNTVHFDRLILQLSPTRQRAHFARCPVLVHELLDGNLAVSFQGQPVARFDRSGVPLATKKSGTRRKVA